MFSLLTQQLPQTIYGPQERYFMILEFTFMIGKGILASYLLWKIAKVSLDGLHNLIHDLNEAR